jgi:hypothetical protein
MNRREALQNVTLLLGGAISISTASVILNGCKPKSESALAPGQAAFSLSPENSALLEELTEIIIPKTDTPGAKEAGVGAFIVTILSKCYETAQQDHFVKGFDLVRSEAKKAGGDLASLSDEQKINIMKTLKDMASKEKEAEKAKMVDPETGLEKQDAKMQKPLVPFFDLLRELTVFGYFSSETGAKSNLDYVSVPGRYDACIKITPETKAYAL